MSGKIVDNQELKAKNQDRLYLLANYAFLSWLLILDSWFYSSLQPEAVSNTQANKVYFAIANTAYKFGRAFVPYTCIDNVFTT